MNSSDKHWNTTTHAPSYSYSDRVIEDCITPRRAVCMYDGPSYLKQVLKPLFVCLSSVSSACHALLDRFLEENFSEQLLPHPLGSEDDSQCKSYGLVLSENILLLIYLSRLFQLVTYFWQYCRCLLLFFSFSFLTLFSDEHFSAHVALVPLEVN